MSNLPCTEIDPCLWNYNNFVVKHQEQPSAFFRWSVVKNTGTIEKINMQVQPLEEDWIEFEFAAGKAPKYNPVEETYETLGAEPLPPLPEEATSGGGTPFVWAYVPPNTWNPFHPNFPWNPWNPGNGCKHHCGTPDKPVFPEPAPVPLPAGALLLPVGMVLLYLLKKWRNQ